MGATPGVTTTAQTVSIDSKVKLMDCPGIVFARASTEDEVADVALRNCVSRPPCVRPPEHVMMITA